METDEQAAQRLERMIDDAHLDARVHPDPCGDSLIRLIQAIENHASEEKRSIREYAELSLESQDPSVKTVMRLLLDDENRHHRQFLQIASSLRARLNWHPVPSSPAADAEAAAWAQRILECEAEERRGAQELRELAHCIRREGDRLAGLLLDAMAMDSDKHAHLLAFVHHQLVSEA